MRRLSASLALLFACGDNRAGVDPDAGPPDDAAIAVDAAEARDGAVPLAWIDFAASGCTGAGPSLPSGEPSCAGEAPLQLTFQALAPSALDEYRWRFGDEGMGEEPTATAVPAHIYTTPGTYDVTLTASGPGGSGSLTKVGYVVVTPASLGATCTVDEQCDAGECVCAMDMSCPPGLETGFCAARCGSDPCESGTCVDLRPTISTADWHDQLCARACSEDSDCPADRPCKNLRDGDGGWTRGCFPAGIVGDIGASCTTAAGPDDDLCASGSCLAEGARGLCASACNTTADCPQGSACATFGGPLGKQCVLRCSEEALCTSDPWLACEAPGITAPKGFTVDETPSPAGYCAPRRCTDPGDCGTDGACVSGYCAAP